MSGPRAPRVVPIPVEEWGDAEVAAARTFLPEDRMAQYWPPTPDSLRVPNVMGTLLRHPDLASAWFPYSAMLLRAGALSDRLREIVILRVAWQTRSEYEWAQHVRMGRRAGLTDAEFEAIGGADTHEWTPLETDLLAATDELLDRYRISEATWQRLITQLPVEQLMELVFVVGTYVTLAMAFRTFGVEPDPEFVEFGAPPMPADPDDD